MWLFIAGPPQGAGEILGSDINVVLTPDGKQVILRTMWWDDNGLESVTTVLNTADGSVAGSLALPVSHPGDGSLSISPDGKLLLVTGVDENDNSYANFFRLSDGALLPGPATKLSSFYDGIRAQFASDGSTLLLFGVNPAASAVQTEFWRLPNLTLQSVVKDEGAIMDCSADGRSLLIVRYINEGNYFLESMDLVRASDGVVLATLPSQADEGLTGRFSPDGKTIELAGEYALVRSRSGELTEGVVELWRTSDQKLLNRNLTISPGAVAAGFQPLLKAFVVWAYALQYRNLSDGSLQKSVLTDNVRATYSVAMSPDGRLIARSSREEPLSLLNTADGTVNTFLPSLLVSGAQMVFSHDGKILLSASLDSGPSYIELWSVATGKLITRLSVQKQNSVALSPDGTLVAITSNVTVGTTSTLQLQVIRVKDGAAIVTANTGFDGNTAIMFSPDGATVTVAGITGPSPNYTYGLQQWKVSTGKSVWNIQTTNIINLLVLSSDGKMLACATHDYNYHNNSIELRTLATGALMRTIPSDQLSTIDGLCWTPGNTSLIATGSPVEYTGYFEKLEWWNASTGTSEGWRLLNGSLSAITPDGSLIAGTAVGTAAFVAPSPTFMSPSLKSLTLSAGSVKGGGTVTGTVTLTSVAPFDGTTVALTSSQGSIAPVPASVTVVGNSVKISFTIATAKVTATTAVTITAKLSSVTQTAPLNITQ
jgi:roadblock/LC7 domain-containing protein